MAQQLVVRFTSATGKPAHMTTFYTVNQRGFPFFSEWRKVGDGELAVRYPQEQPFGMEVLWDVPGFGRVMVAADNEGQLYRIGQDQVVDFRTEATKTKMRKMTERLQAATQRGIGVSAGLVKKIEQAQAQLALALTSLEGEAQARALDAILATAFWAGEALELEIAHADLAAMSLDERRAKRFGASFFQPDAPESFMVQFEQLFNFATIPFYRRQVESVEGQPEWGTRDRLLDWLDERQMPRKGHPLTWWIEHGLTDWMKKLSYKTLKEVMYQQVFDTVTRYKGRVKIWDVINEAHDPIVKGNDLNLSTEQVYEITALACKATRDADPEAIRIVNINRPWCVYGSEWELMETMHAVEYVEELAARGIDYEVLGVQMYHGGPEHYVRDMAQQSAMLDQYLAMGKPVHISEVQTPSSMEAEPLKWLGGGVAQSGWWHRPWDPEVQADWAEQLYTIAASKSQLEAVTWWNLSDRRSFWPHGGLLDHDNLPKPAYHRLKAFIEQMQSEQGF